MADQQAGRGAGAAADAPAELVELRRARSAPRARSPSRSRSARRRRPRSRSWPPARASAPRANAAITCSFSALFSRPCSSPTRAAGSARAPLLRHLRGRAHVLELLRFLDQRVDDVGLAARARSRGAHRARPPRAARRPARGASRSGVRPGGRSSTTERSRSPYAVSASERGIGVAVSTSTSASPPPLRARSSRCSTPKRCCSSTTASPRRREADLLLDERVRAHRDLRSSPEASRAARGRAVAALARGAGGHQLDRVRDSAPAGAGR